ncbi:MAG TPA: hypothetical protein DCY12_00665 [Candidatus Atribacteria bacterium]|nr:hypothetical protein [Candidatus Atribacteria bacterium]
MIQIRELFLAECENRKKIAETKIDPMIWIKKGLSDNYSVMSFQFFVDWNKNPYEVTGPLWVSFLVEASKGINFEEISSQEIIEVYKKTNISNLLEKLTIFSNRLKTSAECILLSEMEVNEISESNPVWIVTQTENKEGSHFIKKINLKKLSSKIKENRKGSASLGSKGLIYGTSAIECWLSKTPNLYPGDCDCLIFYNDIPVSIIEFKKHTLKTPISNNLANKYYPIPDGRKYDSLFALKKKIDASFNLDIPFSIVYFSTKFNGYRVQVIEKGNNALNIVSDTKDLDYKNYNDQVLIQIGKKILEEVLP